MESQKKNQPLIDGAPPEKEIGAITLEKLYERRKGFESVRDQALGAIQAIDIILNDIKRADEQVEKTEDAQTTGQDNTKPVPNGNGYAHQNGK